jgi:hypothetical protein
MVCNSDLINFWVFFVTGYILDTIFSQTLTMSKASKITAEKLIEDRQGIDKLIKEFKEIDLLGKDQEIEAFRNIIMKYQIWAALLSPVNILDFARSVENALAGEAMRQQLLNYRVDHLRREGVFQISEEELRKQKAELNKQRALAKRRQMDEEKDKQARKNATQSERIDDDEDRSVEGSNDENDSIIDDGDVSADDGN